MKAILFWAFIFLASVDVFALGNDRGNGGGVFYCSQNTVRPYIFIDFWEAAIRVHDWKLDFGPFHLSYKEKVEYALHRFRKISPRRAEKYLEWLSKWDKESTPVQGRLVEVRDSFDFAFPIGCTRMQAAVQHEPSTPAEFRYKYDAEIFSKLSEDDKAGLVLHELIYREFQKFHDNSISVRHLNSLIASEQLSKLTPESFIKDYLIPLKTEDYDFLGVPITLGKLSRPLESDPEPRFPVFTDEYVIEYTDEGQIRRAIFLHANDDKIILAPGFDISFSKRRKIYQADFYNGFIYQVSPVNISSTNFKITDATLSVSNGYPSSSIAENLIFGPPELTTLNRQHSLLKCTINFGIRGENIERVHNCSSGKVQFLQGELQLKNLYNSTGEFHEDGSYRLGLEAEGTLTVGPDLVRVQGSIRGYRGGRFASGQLVLDSRVKVGQRSVLLKKASLIELSPDGWIRKGTLADDAILPNLLKQEKLYPKDSELRFDENGQVLP